MTFKRYLTLGSVLLSLAISSGCRPDETLYSENINDPPQMQHGRLEQPKIKDEYDLIPARPHPIPSPEKAIALIFDTSGSMNERVGGERKIDIASRSLDEMMKYIHDYYPQRGEIKVGLFYFNGDAVKLAVPVSDFDYKKLHPAITSREPFFGASLGAALAYAERELDKNSDGKKNIILLADGINSLGLEPDVVFRMIKMTNDEYKDSPTNLYIVAYDTDKNNFNNLEKQGAKVYEARNEIELTAALTSIREEILPEPLTSLRVFLK